MDSKAISTETVVFMCRFKRFSTYLANGKRIRFADGMLKTSDADTIAFLRKNYRPPLMTEVKGEVHSKPEEKAAAAPDPEHQPEPVTPPTKKGK